MNRIGFLCIDWSHFVNGLTDDIQHSPEGLFTDGNRDARAGIHDFYAAHQAFGGIHGDAAHRVFTEVLRHFEDEIPLLIADRRVGNFQRVVNGRKRGVGKLDVDNGAKNLGDFPRAHNLETSNNLLVFTPLPSSPVAREKELGSYFSASAVPTISINSRVIDAWRARFICRVRLPIILDALLVAESMAVM